MRDDGCGRRGKLRVNSAAALSLDLELHGVVELQAVARGC